MKLEPGESKGESTQKSSEPAESKPSKPSEEAPSTEGKQEAPAPQAAPPQQTKSTGSTAQEKAPSPPKQEQPKPEKAQSGTTTAGNREERRVCSGQGGCLKQWLTTSQVKMNRMRLRIAERLKQSQNTAASLTTFNEVDMSSLMEFRKLYKDEVLKNTGVKLGFMSAFSRACVLAMKDVPAVNASIEGPNGGDTIVYRDYVDISVAVATEKGLVTPVVRNAESLGMVSTEKAIADLGKKVRPECYSVPKQD